MLNPGLRVLTKHLLLIFFFSTGCIGLNAQKYSVGIRLGGSMTWPGFADDEEKEGFTRNMKLGHSAMALIAFPMKKDFHMVAEAGYGVRGRRVKYDSENGEGVNRSTYRFIDMNMLLRKSFHFQLEKNIPAVWYVNFGPEVSYWLSGDGEFIIGGRPWDYKMKFDEDFGSLSTNPYTMAVPDANRWLFGIAFGVGVKAPLHNAQHIGVELRYSSGHTFLSDKKRFVNADLGTDPRFPLPSTDDTMKVNLKSLTLAISYTFDFDKQKSRQGKSTLDKKVKSKKPRHRLR